jgi:putative polyketide hydroxylase
VLIVGGSIVGLSAATFLAARGVRAIVVERRQHASRRLRAKLFYPRTMEAYRSVDRELERRIFASEPKSGPKSLVAIVESLAGAEVKRWSVPAAADVSELSPTRSAFLKQRDLEGVMRTFAVELGADVRFGFECVTFEQQTDFVVATIRETSSGVEQRVEACYVIAADGNRSFIRERLGIRCVGLGDLSYSHDIGFRADVRAAVADRPLAFVFVRQPDLSAYVAWEDSLDAGTVSVSFDPATTDVRERFSDANCLDIASRALGLPKEAIAIVGHREWPMSSWVAERYGDGRVFLAGDSAHVTPPVGGFGANTGIQDAHNLCAKLAQVLRREASPTLLRSYDAERQPIGRMTIDQATLRLAGRPDIRVAIDAAPLLPELAVTLGYRYRSEAIASKTPADAPVAVEPSELCGAPGTRAPHIVLQKSDDGTTLSSLDLFGRRVVLLTGSAGGAWRTAMPSVAAVLDVNVDVYQIGYNLLDVSGRFNTLYGIENDGAVLVRHDGFVAWRAQRQSVDVLADIQAAMELLLCRRATTSNE